MIVYFCQTFLRQSAQRLIYTFLLQRLKAFPFEPAPTHEWVGQEWRLVKVKQYFLESCFRCRVSVMEAKMIRPETTHSMCLEKKSGLLVFRQLRDRFEN
jgi:hypothetical protein